MMCNNAAFTYETLVGMDPMHPTMARLYKAATKLKGITKQAGLARALNTSSQRVKNWERRGISQQGAHEAQAALGVNATWVLEAEGGMNAASAVSSGEIPAGYVRFQLHEGAAGMGAGVVNEDYPEVIQEVDIAAWEVRRKLGFLPSPGRIRMITGRGPSMRPMIDNGDVVMVDTAVANFDGDAVYVINIGGETQIKMLQMRGDGLYVVSANPDYPAYKVERGETLHVGGKVSAVMGIKEL